MSSSAFISSNSSAFSKVISLSQGLPSESAGPKTQPLIPIPIRPPRFSPAQSSSPIPIPNRLPLRFSPIQIASTSMTAVAMHANVLPNSTTTLANSVVQKVNERAILKAKSFRPSMQKKNTKKFSCDTCQKKFTRSDCFQLHKYVHLSKDQWPLKCAKCPKRFCKLFNLNKHEKTVHDKVSAYGCTLCSMTYTSKQNLNKHMQKKH